MKYSLIMASFQRPHLLNYGLFSIDRNTGPDLKKDLEIIVLNDGTKDETENVCHKYPKLNIRYLFTGQRNQDGIKWRVPGFALNIGVKRASGDIIILSCPEIWHINNAIENVIYPFKFHQNLLTIPEYMYFDDNKVILPFLDSGARDIPTSLLTNCVVGARGKQAVTMPFFMGIRKEDFINIGGYDEDFLGTCADDNDLIDRFLAKGLIHFKTKAQIIHLWHEGNNNGLVHWDNPAWVLNYNLYKSRKGQIIRNQGREWGVL